MKIRVLGETVYLTPIKKERKNNIVIPGKEDLEDTGLAEVAYVGDKCTKIKVGDIVAVPQFGVAHNVIGGVSYLIVNENNIHTVIDEYYQ